jgi:hypothetical protein
VNIREVQAEVWRNKLAKGFNVTDVARDFRRLREEVDEAEKAWLLGAVDAMALELADVAAFAAGLAEMVGADLDDAVARKLVINAARTYVRGPDGEMVRVETVSPDA